MGAPKSGIAMLLSSLGVDGAEIQKAISDMPAFVARMELRFQSIEQKLHRVLSILESEVIDAGPGPAIETHGGTEIVTSNGAQHGR
jgi:hypothetical protein